MATHIFLAAMATRRLANSWSTPSIGKVRDADEWLCYGTYVAQRIVVKWIKSTQCITHGGLNIWLTDLGDSSAFVNHISVVAM